MPPLLPFYYGSWQSKESPKHLIMARTQIYTLNWLRGKANNYVIVAPYNFWQRFSTAAASSSRLKRSKGDDLVAPSWAATVQCAIPNLGRSDAMWSSLRLLTRPKLQSWVLGGGNWKVESGEWRVGVGWSFMLPLNGPGQMAMAGC